MRSTSGARSRRYAGGVAAERPGGRVDRGRRPQPRARRRAGGRRRPRATGAGPRGRRGRRPEERRRARERCTVEQTSWWYPGEGQRLGATAAPRRRVALEDLDVEPGAGELEAGGEAVRARADDDRVRHGERRGGGRGARRSDRCGRRAMPRGSSGDRNLGVAIVEERPPGVARCGDAREDLSSRAARPRPRASTPRGSASSAAWTSQNARLPRRRGRSARAGPRPWSARSPTLGARRPASDAEGERRAAVRRGRVERRRAPRSRASAGVGVAPTASRNVPSSSTWGSGRCQLVVQVRRDGVARPPGAGVRDRRRASAAAGARSARTGRRTRPARRHRARPPPSVGRRGG